jgi:putative ABC transport system ATP-binding protein
MANSRAAVAADGGRHVVCTDLSKVYSGEAGDVAALKRINFTINHGEFVALCGPSGSGKTTLLNLIGALDRASSGKVIVGGVNLESLSNSERADFRLHSLGFVFQAYNLIPILTAEENIAFILAIQGVSSKKQKARAEELLNRLGLAGMGSRRPAQLSGGQQQRVAVARALASEPILILADEPTANLDSQTAKSLLELMLEINREDGVTFLFSTHDPLVMSYARRLVELHDGEIVSDKIRD